MASLKSFASVDRFVTEIASPATLRPAYILLGDEVFLYDRCRKAVLATLAPEDTRDFCLHDLDLAETSIFEVLDRAQTPSLMAPFQVLFVRNLKTLYGRGSKKEEFAAIDAYFRAPNPQALLLFVADHLRIPTDLRKMDYQDKERFEKIRETLGDWCGTVELARVDENDAIKWVTTTAESRNIKFDPDAARELVDSLGADMMLIASEFEKLLLYVSGPAAQPIEGVIPTEARSAQWRDPRISSEAPRTSPETNTTPLTKNRVTLGDVETMVLAAKQRSLYELTDAISAKDRPRALLLLHGLLNASDGGEDAAIGHLYMLARTFRQMLIISEKNVRDPRAIWQVLWQGFRMPPFAAEDLIKQARRYKSRRELTRAIRLVARADLELRSSPANKLLVLERLILDLSTEPKPTPYDPTHQFAMEL
ncbi:DNA polymerase III subunit delta [Tunturibacter empetritectus]|uniref:DNA polymerase III subunit delta n=1 Tax=Tunturiibacter empetritectus TaxID=3069691 RepID=A0A7W8MSA9_9BACT|nr:DNA polymerase III subunit delta [Edaphobacter lichenicola]MBB5317680.1 DNA polymerase-3 subunit delta [Edaphobacter lichenicola]